MSLVEELRQSIQRKNTVILVARCTITYEGRASSKLGEGERIILIKEDGAVIVHRPFSYEPVNYQPPGSIITVEEAEGSCRLIALRPRIHEKMVIELKEVKHFFSSRLEDRAEFHMWGDEQDLRQAIILDPVSTLGEELELVGSEFSLGSAGYADIVFRDKEGNLVVVEVKRKTADVSSVYQLKRYVEKIRRECKKNLKVRAILAAPKFTPAAIVVLKREGLEYREVNLQHARKILKQKGNLPSFFHELA
ncbi:MAG: endonuclease NucS [Thermofilum sp.]|nr:endonuclease NucS [Thermofilum sp.]